MHRRLRAPLRFATAHFVPGIAVAAEARRHPAPSPLSADLPMRRLLIALAAVATFAPALRAQEAAPADPLLNHRVRLVLTKQPRVEGRGGIPDVVRGTLLAIDPDSLTVAGHEGTTPYRIARSVVRRAYVSKGIQGRGEAGALGALAGASAGLGTCGYYGNDCHTSKTDLVLAAAGGVLGAVIGATHPHEKWRLVHLPAAAAMEN